MALNGSGGGMSAALAAECLRRGFRSASDFAVRFYNTVLRMRGARFPELYFVCLAAAGDLAREGVGVSVSAHVLCARTKGSEKIKLKFDFKK